MVLRVAAPTVALVASFLPWMTVGVVTRTRHWDAYHLGGASWLWLVLDAAAIIVAAASRWVRLERWLTLAWSMLAALSLGTGIAGFVLVSVSAHVSTILSAPNPLTVSFGLGVFAAACAAWCLVGFGPWPDPAMTVGQRPNR